MNTSEILATLPELMLIKNPQYSNPSSMLIKTDYTSTLKNATVGSSETLVSTYNITWCCSSE
jgi:hypothetical protein